MFHQKDRFDIQKEKEAEYKEKYKEYTAQFEVNESDVEVDQNNQSTIKNKDKKKDKKKLKDSQSSSSEEDAYSRTRALKIYKNELTPILQQLVESINNYQMGKWGGYYKIFKSELGNYDQFLTDVELVRNLGETYPSPYLEVYVDYNTEMKNEFLKAIKNKDGQSELEKEVFLIYTDILQSYKPDISHVSDDINLFKKYTVAFNAQFDDELEKLSEKIKQSEGPEKEKLTKIKKALKVVHADYLEFAFYISKSMGMYVSEMLFFENHILKNLNADKANKEKLFEIITLQKQLQKLSVSFVDCATGSGLNYSQLVSDKKIDPLIKHLTDVLIAPVGTSRDFLKIYLKALEALEKNNSPSKKKDKKKDKKKTESKEKTVYESCATEESMINLLDKFMECLTLVKFTNLKDRAGYCGAQILRFKYEDGVKAKKCYENMHSKVGGIEKNLPTKKIKSPGHGRHHSEDVSLFSVPPPITIKNEAVRRSSTRRKGTDAQRSGVNSKKGAKLHQEFLKYKRDSQIIPETSRQRDAAKEKDQQDQFPSRASTRPILNVKDNEKKPPAIRVSSARPTQSQTQRGSILFPADINKLPLATPDEGDEDTLKMKSPKSPKSPKLPKNKI